MTRHTHPGLKGEWCEGPDEPPINWLAAIALGLALAGLLVLLWWLVWAIGGLL